MSHLFYNLVKQQQKNCCVYMKSTLSSGILPPQKGWVGGHFIKATVKNSSVSGGYIILHKMG
jgi:hypothetical protein